MIDHEKVALALRARALAVVVATTGSTTLGATSTGYTRPAGSFITDGFRVGMEVTPTGFPETTVGVIEAIAATALTITGGRTAAADASGRTLAVGLPALVGWDNTKVVPVPGRPYLEEELVPATGELLTQASSGTVEHTGLYVLRWYGVEGKGPADLYRCADAVLAKYAPGNAETLSTGDVLRIRGDVAPTRSAVLHTPEGYAVVTITVPYRLLTSNPA